MAKEIYTTVSGSTKKVKSVYAVIDGTTRKIKTVYAVVNGVAKLAWQSVVTKLSTWVHFISRSKFNVDMGSYHMTSVNEPLIIDDNTCVLSSGMRDSSGVYFGTALAVVTTDENSNVVSVPNKYINEYIISKCKLGDFYAVGTRDESGSPYLHIADMNNIYFNKYTRANGALADIYPLNDSTICGVCNNNNYGTQLFVATFDGLNPATINYVTVVSNATNARLIRVSGNQYILIYYLNSACYLVPVIFNSLSSYTLGTAIQLSNAWLSIDVYMSYVIDDNHIVLFTPNNGNMMGVYIRDNVVTLSSELTTSLIKVCRIGTSNSFFGFGESSIKNGIGKIIYYDVSSNYLSISGTSMSATTFTNNSGYNYPSVTSSCFIPKGDKKISMFFSGNNEYMLSFDLSFDV